MPRRNVRLTLGIAAVAVLVAGVAALLLRREGMDVAAATVPPTTMAVPAWAKQSTALTWAYGHNAKVMAEANAKRTKFDVILYGDSITWYHMFENTTSFKKHFGRYTAVPMGVGGATVEDLTLRMMTTEKPLVPPKAMAIMIGTNNRDLNELFTRLELLLTWAKRTFPTTRIVLAAVTPEAKGWGWKQKNAGYKAIAAKLGIPFAQCGLELNPLDPSLFPDGLHPNAKGYDILLPCLARAMGLSGVTRRPRR